MPGEGVGVAGLSLVAVNHPAVCGGHIVIALFAVGGRQPAFALSGVEVEGLQNVRVRKLDVAGAFLVKRGGEIVQLDLLGLAALFGGIQHGAEFVPIVGLAVRVQEVQHPLDLGNMACCVVPGAETPIVCIKGVAAENHLAVDLVRGVRAPAVVIMHVLAVLVVIMQVRPVVEQLYNFVVDAGKKIS